MVRGVPPGDEHGDQPDLDRLEDGDGLAVGHSMVQYSAVQYRTLQYLWDIPCTDIPLTDTISSPENREKVSHSRKYWGQLYLLIRIQTCNPT